MFVSPLQLLSNSQIYVSGDVTVEEGAAIAPGVILQAEPNCKIKIGAGACIGLGTIIHARQGSLVIEAGVILGTGVLIVGAGKVGVNACIGSGVTILNPAIKDSEMLAAGALIGDESRKLNAGQEVSELIVKEGNHQELTVKPEVSKSIIEDESPQEEEKVMSEVPESVPPIAEEMTEDVWAQVKEERSPETVNSPPTIFHGQAHINSLLTIMFPHRVHFNIDQNSNLSGSSEQSR
ncbi:carbon dioxide concentrating mechanism protein [Oscillatoriales cyanobacterium USR001]|nr:carbon dioxide concentrating mechanism protein [Oscillatoriales cyanobacterium USR001]